MGNILEGIFGHGQGISGKMLPRPTVANIADVLLANAKAFSEVFPACVRFPNSANVIGGKNGQTDAFTLCVTVLCLTIGHVVGAGSKEEMVGVDTQANIALVTQTQTIRNGANQQFIGSTMSEVGLSSVSKRPITTRATHDFVPQPATVGLCDMGEEPGQDFTGVHVNGAFRSVHSAHLPTFGPRHRFPSLNSVPLDIQTRCVSSASLESNRRDRATSNGSFDSVSGYTLADSRFGDGEVFGAHTISIARSDHNGHKEGV